MAYWRLHYHLIWATYRRQPLLTVECEAVLQRMISGKAAEIGVFIRALGNTTDHVHLVVEIPPKLAVSECIRQIKGASSHAANRPAHPFRWREGYGALTLSADVLPIVIAYVRNQKRHHAMGTANPFYECDGESGWF